METTQINIPDPDDGRSDLLTDETVQAIRFLFDVDHAFPSNLQGGSDEKPRKWWQRLFGWFVRGGSPRRRDTPQSVSPGGVTEDCGL